jgi:hypothetical protein
MPGVPDFCYEAKGILLAGSMGRWTRTQVPSPLESILNVPPSSRTLSRMAPIPTPEVRPDSMSDNRRWDIPLPQSWISTPICWGERSMVTLATRLPE